VKKRSLSSILLTVLVTRVLPHAAAAAGDGEVIIGVLEHLSPRQQERLDAA